MFPADRPLEGRLILDCSALLPGPHVGKLLAEAGARVLKIENPRRPDPARSMTAFYEDLNERKELVLLDFTTEEGRARFHELVRQAHGLIEGFRPQAKLKLGLDEATLHAVNPRLCILSLVGYPESSPWRDRAGHDLNFAAVTGCASLFSEMPALPLADLFGAYEGAFALTAAMDAVARGAPGRRTVITLVEALERAQSSVIREFRLSGEVPRPGETFFSGKFPCYRIYVAQDGRRISVGAIEGKFWQEVCDILGLSELGREGLATGEHAQTVIAQVQAAFASRPWTEWAKSFAKADCCVEPILDYSEVFHRPS